MSTVSHSSTEAVAGSPCPPKLEEESQEFVFAVLRLKTKSKGSKLSASVRGVYRTEEQAYAAATQSLFSELEAACGEEKLLQLRTMAFEKTGLPTKERLQAIAATHKKNCSSCFHRLEFVLQKTRLYGGEYLGEMTEPLPCQQEDDEDENDEDYRPSDVDDDLDYPSDVDEEEGKCKRQRTE